MERMLLDLCGVPRVIAIVFQVGLGLGCTKVRLLFEAVLAHGSRPLELSPRSRRCYQIILDSAGTW